MKSFSGNTIFGLVLILYLQKISGEGYSDTSQKWSVAFSRNYTGVIFNERDVLYNSLLVNSPKNGAEFLASLEKIYTKFGKIVISLDCKSTEVNAEGLRKAILKLSEDKPVDIYILIKEQGCVAYQKPAKLLSRTFTTANSTLPGSPLHVIFPTDLIFSGSGWMSEFAEEFQNNASHHSTIKLGVYLEAHDVTAFLEQILIKSLYQIDSILLTSRPTENEVLKPVNDYVNKITKIFEEAKNKILATNSWVGKAHLGIITGWPDISRSGSLSYYKLVQFWKLMNHWADDKKALVIFDRAIDKSVSDSAAPLFERTCGWWRLVDSSAYNSPTDFKFEEKANLISDDVHLRTIKINENTVLLNPDKTCRFSDNNIVTWQSHSFYYGHGDETTKNISQLVTQVALVSKTFSKIMINLGSFDEDILPSVVQAVSEHNSRNPETPAEVVLGIFPSPRHPLVLNAVSGVDLDFPDAIKIILFHMSYQARAVDSVKRLVSNKANKEIAYGVILPFDSCLESIESPTFRKSIIPYLSPSLQLKYIVFDPLRFDRLVDGATKLFTRVITVVEVCRRKIELIAARNNRTSPQVGFITGWYSRDKQSESAQMINYWELLDSWSRKTNITVIYRSAFGATQNHRSLAWWILAENKTEFIERKTVILQRSGRNDSQNENLCDDPKSKGTSTIADTGTSSITPEGSPSSFTLLQILLGVGTMGGVFLITALLLLSFFHICRKKELRNETMLDESHVLRNLNR